MRKDLKIGMAIGGVLLAVMVVYFAMPKPEGADVAGLDVGEDAVAVDDREATAESVTEEGREAEPVTPATTDTQKPDVFAKGGDADADAEESATARDVSGTNWAKLLEDGEGTLVPLRTTTPAVADRGNGANDAAIPAAAGTGSSSPGGSASQSGDVAAAGRSPGAAPGPTDATGAQGETGASTTLRPDDASATVPGQVKQAAVDPPGRYTIKAGDNFSTIAQDKYGSSRHYLAIEKANPDLDATRIRPGTVINLPDPATLKGSGERAAAKVLDPETEYEVQPNDSLYKIAVERYGSAKVTDELYELNKATIGPDPKRLKLGMVLKLPPKPKSDESASR